MLGLNYHILCTYVYKNGVGQSLLRNGQGIHMDEYVCVCVRIFITMPANEMLKAALAPNINNNNRRNSLRTRVK